MQHKKTDSGTTFQFLKRNVYYVLLFLLLSLSCNQDETIVDPGNGGGTSTTILITAPAGNEALKVGSSKEIIWQSNSTNKLKIELSTDAGALWSVIADNVSNTGRYTWTPVPNSLSDRCLIRITDKANASVSDVTDNFFKIVPNINKTLTLTKPNGADSVIVGSSYRIQWVSQNVTAVKIEYTPNNGSSWSLITAGTPADSQYYVWTPVPNTLSAQCKIRLTDISADTITDQSDNLFSIVTNKVITVTQPNGGENVSIGSNYTITWTSSNVGNVKIEYSTNNGSAWTLLAGSIPNTGTYQWTSVPNSATSLGLVRITDANDANVSDVSNGNFSISVLPSITLLTPNGGENLIAGDITTITWNSTGASNEKSARRNEEAVANKTTGGGNSPLIDNVKLEYSTNSGSTWNTIIASTPNLGTYSWTVPAAATTAGRVRVSDAAAGTVSDISNSDFTITIPPPKALALLTPNGGEVWEGKTIRQITWISTRVNRVRLEYSLNNGLTWRTITADTTAAGGVYNWTIPDTNSTFAVVRITDVQQTSLNDVSNAPFTVTPAQTITVIKPNGAEVLTSGGSYGITWTSTNLSEVKIEYTTNNGVTWTGIVDRTESDGFYQWNPVPTIQSANCRIRISDPNDGFPVVQSAAVFSILAEPTLKITYPNGGERVLAGSSISINWNTITPAARIGKTTREDASPTDLGIASVKLEYSTDGGASWTQISATTPNTGSYVWNPVPNVNSALCKIRVSDASDNFPFDVSDSSFVIYNQLSQSITVTSPNGGENLTAGANADITWQSTGIASVTIQFTTNNGVNWTTIASNTESDGYFLWSPVPSVSSTNCKIKIFDAADSTPVDESNNSFTITPQPSIAVLTPNGGESYTSGTQQNITWTSQNVAAVSIELSINNGASWSVLVDSIPSNGVYTWTVPNANSTLCRIRVKNKANGGVPADISDNNFTISNVLPQSIRVTRPNGGESFTSGTVQNISWVSSGFDSVKIEFTTNNGQNWSTIINRTPSSGVYSWQVPVLSSSNCKVRISDALDGQPVDLSDSVFSIAPAPSVAITSPNGGERILAGTSHTITWNSVGSVGNLKLEYSTDAGLSYTQIAASVTNTGNYQWNPVPSVSSALYRIRISDVNNASVSDISDSNFTVYTTQPQNITVTAPNGGETYTSGGSVGITWQSSGISNVTIQFSTNNGVNWSTIANNIESNGFYQWSPIPNVSSTNCRVKIFDAVDSLPSDESNAAFTILPAPAITVSAPNGGETFVSGTQTNITWTSQNIAAVKIEFSINNGASWSTVTDSVASIGSFLWTVPNVSSALCRIKVSNKANAGVPSDISDNNFTVSNTVPQTVRVTSPNGGETFIAGTTQNVTWVSAGIDSVKLEFTTNNGQTWTSISNKAPSSGVFQWLVPSVSSTNCKIRVSDATDGTPNDASDNTFTIALAPALTVVSPNGGDRILAGSSRTITWTTTGSISSVKLELSTDAGLNFSVLAASVTNNGTYQWNPVPNVSSALCRVRISDVNNASVTDISDSNFTIYTQAAQTIAVTAPNGGETFTAGGSTGITWQSSGIGNVTIQFSSNSGVNWSTVASNVESNGFYQWNPIPNVSSTNCRIRIFDAADSIPGDESNASFTILPAPAVSVLSPNGGENFVAGNITNITWTSQNVSAVKIELSTNNGAGWTTITDSTVSNGLFAWTVPAVNSTLCRIRISNKANAGVPADISDNNFTILGSVPQSVKITRPNGGESFTSGTTQNITWTASGIDSVKIEFSVNNGQNWSTVVNKVASSGVYLWTIPAVNSTNCLVRISDGADGSPVDVSDSLFRIAPAPTITITSPNGNERILAGSGTPITWTSTGSVNDVKIEFSTDAGATFSTLAGSVTNNGNYQWNPVPVVSSALCRIRISDVTNASVGDISDNNFTIYTQATQTLTVTAPNGGETFTAGGSTGITWQSSGISNVTIQFSTNNGVNWSAVASNVESNGFYQWSPIPNVSSTNCKIRIYDVADTTPVDESNAAFTILPAPSVSVTSPNGGENFVSGAQTSITWSSQNIAAVKIEFSSNNGANWSSVVDSTNSNGSYLWTVPSVNSSLCRIKISNQSGGVPSDISDNAFTVSSSTPQSVRVTRPNGGESFTVGTTQNITWVNSGIDTAKIEFSTNNGQSWNTVIAKTPGSGVFAWTVPSVSSSNCKVRVSDAVDGTPSDVSDDVFSIAPAPALTIVSPNGGERVVAGGSRNITWTTQGTVTNISLDYSTDAGSSWTSIITGIANTGTYVWNPVPVVSSAQSRVRVSDANNATVRDISDSNFTIYTQSTQTLTVTTPNGGETFTAGASTGITWQSSGITSVTIQFSSNNGVSWSNVATSIESNGFYQWSPIPNVSSTNCKIRIYDVADSTPVDESNAPFTILPAPSVSVISPNGGESLVSGTQTNITWVSQNIAAVKIEFSSNNGASWSSVTDSTLSNGNFTWTVPGVNSSLCRIKVSNQSGGVPSDISDNSFSVSTSTPQSVRVVRPNGGESFTGGTTQNITWVSAGIDTVKIEYSTNNGQTWTTVVNRTPSSGVYAWTVPAINSANCKIRISDATDGIPADLSDDVFNIAVATSITVTYPNGGERIASGSTQNITWTNTGNITNVVVEFSTDGGNVWSTIISGAANSGSYTWNPVPVLSSAACRVRISDASNNTVRDLSDSNFTIYTQATQSITVTAPNGGETFTAGGSTGITWQSTGINNVSLQYSTNSGVSWTTIASNIESNGFYQWSPIPNVSSTNCRIKIYDAADSTPVDESNASFTILPAPSVTVLSPNGGESLTGGTQVSIRWTSANMSAVKIELSSNGGASWSSIIDSTLSNGLYVWTVPSVTSTLCKVRISNQSRGVPLDESDNVFSISTTTPQSITLNAPNGGEVWSVGSVQNITWTSSGIDSVKIEVSTNNGVNWSTLVSKTQSNGLYTINPVPSLSSTNCKVRISDANDSSPADESNAVFTITTAPAITVLAPNGGETLIFGNSANIRWRSDNLSKVKIEFTTNSGASWTVLTDSTESIGSYLWTLPNLNSTQCKIRISEPKTGFPFDMSDSNFTISNQITQSLTVNSPNGGEIWEATTVQNITWVSSAITKVKLEFTTNNGLTWTTIVDSTESNGLYQWTVPNVTSSLCKVRISDITDGSPLDESNSVFTIRPASSIRVTYPNGGETFTAGTLYSITWASSGVSNVGIEYRIGEFGEWTSIVQNTPSDGSYDWSPSSAASGYKIRITDANNATPTDESDGTFTVLDEPAVRVIAPNGGQSLQAGTTYDIKWTSVGLSNVRIDLSTNNGASWSQITATTTSNGVFTWTVPSLNSALCKIRIADTDTLPSDASDSAFTIYNVIPQTVTVISPNGSENWASGSSQSITWNSSGVDSVKIEFSTNNGATWSTITSSTLSTGQYTWNPIPSTVSTNCKVRISDAADGFPNDESNNVFTISGEPTLRIVSPNGGESWLAGTQQDIRWVSENMTNVKIEFSSNNGASWSTVIASTPSTGLYTWSTVPSVTSDQCRIKVSDAADGNPFDVSDVNFSVYASQFIRVIFPNGGGSQSITTDTTLIWTSAGVSVVDLDLTLDNAATAWSSISANMANRGAYFWTIPTSTFSSLARIRVTNRADTTIRDMSDGTFNLGFLPPGAGIESAIYADYSYKGGTAETIRWSLDDAFTNVTVSVSADAGANWTDLKTEKSTGVLQQMSLPVPDKPSPGYILLRFRDTETSKTYYSKRIRVE